MPKFSVEFWRDTKYKIKVDAECHADAILKIEGLEFDQRDAEVIAYRDGEDVFIEDVFPL